jgi:hypothetical protein
MIKESDRCSFRAATYISAHHRVVWP